MRSDDNRRVSFGFGDSENNNMEGGMCRNKRNWLKLAFSLLCLGSFAAVLPVQAQQNPPTCTFSVATVGLGPFCNSDATGGLLGQPVVVGQTIFYQASVSQNLDLNCGFQGGQIIITLPDGTAVDVTPDGGIPLICGSPGCNPAGVPFVLSKIVPYTVRAVDIGVNQGGFAPCPATNVQATVRYTGGISHCDAGNTCDPTAQTSVCNPARVIGLVVEKAVACTTGQVCNGTLSYASSASGAQLAGNNPEFCYRFIYRNTGTAGLNVTSVVDNVLGALTPPGGLAPGAVVTNFSGVTTIASTTMNTVVARAAQTAQACFSTAVVAQASATATVVPSTISCEVRFLQGGNLLTQNAGCGTACNPPASLVINPGGGPVSVVVRVTNSAGNGQNIVNGVVSVGGNNFNVAGPIAPGGFADVTVDTVNGDTIGCHNYTADAVFQGALTGDCPPIPTTCNNRFEICGEPKICIIKLVKCMENGDPAGECLTQSCTEDLSLYAPSAVGVTDAGFCYGIAIENCGQIPLTDVVVNDSQLGNSLPGFPSTLAVGQSVTNFYPKSYSGFTGTIRNTATVTGQSTGGQVTANTNAVVTLLSPSIICTKTVSLNGGPATAGGTVEVPFGSTNELTFAVIVRNNGAVDLQNVQVIDTGTSGCDPSTNVIAFLPIGASVTNVLCTITEVTCPPTETIISNKVIVTAEVSDQVCSINPANCERITTSSMCDNVITLFCRGVCITRTPGYWFTHWKAPNPNCATLEKAIIAAGGQLDLGFICLSGTTDEVLSQALGIFWSKRNKTSDGKASPLCRARKQLGFHLIAAIANVSLLGTDPSGCVVSGTALPSNLIEQARQAAACGDIGEIRRLTELLDQFNNSGHDEDFPDGLLACKADPRGAKRAQRDPTTVANCNDVSHCASGSACP